MGTVSERLLKAIADKDISYGQLSQLTGIAKSALQRYATGETKKVPLDRLELIANALGVSAASLMGWDTNESTRLPSNCYPIDFLKLKRIPILGRVPAGLPLYVEENIEGYTYTELNGGADYFALRVFGDSMNAVPINEGNLVIVRKQPEVITGEIALVLVDDSDATIKRYYQEGPIITLMPQSYNPIHKPQIYDTRETKIEIVGKVVKVEFMV